MTRDDRIGGVGILITMIASALEQAEMPHTAMTFVVNAKGIASELADKAELIPGFGAVLDGIIGVAQAEYIPGFAPEGGH